MLLFDLSASMGQTEEDGRTRLAVAQDAMISAIGGIEPGSKNIGIRTFSNCGVTSLEAPPGPVDQAALAATISSFRVFGATDIATALEEAAVDLAGQTGRHSVILLSDGEQTCSGDPCATAQALVASGIDVLIHAIGIGTAGTAAEEQLACIAGATGGTVVSVDNAPDLFEAIDDAINDGEPTGGLIVSALPTCINSPGVQADDSLANLVVGNVYTDNAGVLRTLVTGAACDFWCEDGFDINCDGALGDFCPSELDVRSVADAGKCLELLGEKADPTQELDENGNPTLDAILAHACLDDVVPAPDMVEPCEHFAIGKDFEARADSARSVGDAFLADWNETLAADAFEQARADLDAAIQKYMSQGRTFREAMRRVVTGQDLPELDLPVPPQYAIWQELHAFPILGSEFRDVRVLFQPTSNPAGRNALTQVAFQDDALTQVAFQQADQDWDCDQANFRDSQTSIGITRMQWGAPDRAELFASTLFRIDGPVPLQEERIVWTTPFVYFTDLDPAGEYAVVVTAEATRDTRPIWIGTCVTILGAHQRGEVADELDLDPLTGGATLESEYLRAVGEQMDIEQFAQLLHDNFAAISGNDRKIQANELSDAFRNPALDDDVRAAAIRGFNTFAALDVAAETDLGERLRFLNTSFPSNGDGDVSRDDLTEFPYKFAALVTLSPWLPLIDAAGQGDSSLDAFGWLELTGVISRDDVQALVEMEDVPNLIKVLALEVFSGLSETQALAVPPLIGVGLDPLDLLELETTVQAGTKELTTSPRQWRAVLRQRLTRVKGLLRRGTGPTAAFWAGWEVGTELRERYDANPPTDIYIIDPATGQIEASVGIDELTQFPRELWPEIIEIIVATRQVPEPEDEDEDDTGPDDDRDEDNCETLYPTEARIQMANVALADARRINLRTFSVPEHGDVFGGQTVAVFVACNTVTLEALWFTAGQRNLSLNQREFARQLGITAFNDARAVHAEPKVVENALSNGILEPMAIGASNAFCPAENQGCRVLIEDVMGATILGPDVAGGVAERRAYWPAGG